MKTLEALANAGDAIGNIALGSKAGFKLELGDQNIYIGNKGATQESNTIRIGKGVHTRAFLAGVASAPVNGAQVMVASDGQLGVLLSSARYKERIRPMGSQTAKLMKLRPVTFRYKQDAERLLQYGLVAEQVAAVYPELVIRGRDGKVESVRYHELVPMLLNEVQRQRCELESLKATIAERLERLERGAGSPATLAAADRRSAAP